MQMTLRLNKEYVQDLILTVIFGHLAASKLSLFHLCVTC